MEIKREENKSKRNNWLILYAFCLMVVTISDRTGHNVKPLQILALCIMIFAGYKMRDKISLKIIDMIFPIILLIIIIFNIKWSI